MEPTTEPTALVIDDDPGFCTALQRMLTTIGYTSHLAGSAEAGLVVLDQLRVDVVLLDLALPGMQGDALLDHLRAHRPSLPVVVASGTCNVEDVVRVLRHDAVSFLHKPFDVAALRLALMRVVRDCGSRQVVSPEELKALLDDAPGPGSAPSEPVVVLLVDDDANYRRALSHILADSQVQILEAPDGIHALRILEQHPVAIVVSDQIMPGMDGTLLLETIWRRWPATFRVLLTGHPGADVFMEAVNRGGIHKALSKQLPVEDLRGELARVINDALAGRSPGQ